MRVLLFVLLVILYSAILLVICVGSGMWVAGPSGAVIGYFVALAIADMSGGIAASTGIADWFFL